ncbi:MAG: CpXC domain-containing protein [Treponema sp.]|jgi:hypothetical protein|nr:CpXC domain-containing protein [Treponema sp.]
MKQKIPCPCDNSFSVEVPEEIDLDQKPECLDEIMDGSFMNFTCPSCGKKHKPEFPLMLLWPSRKLRFEILPELERGEFYRRKKDPPGAEILIGYPEMTERLTAIRDGLEPAAVEALKYYLLAKAEENYPDTEIDIWYQNKGPEHIEFHLHGIREGEVAVSRVPLSLYQRTLEDYQKHPRGEIFRALRCRSYLSVQNMMRPEGLT